MSRYWSDRTRTIEPYVPGEQPQDKQYIKLNTNENPFPPSPFVKQSFNAIDEADLRLYPEPAAMPLRRALAAHYDVAESEVFVGNGSDEVLAFAFMAFFNRQARLYYPDITYSFYPVYAHLFQLDAVTVPVDDNFAIRPLDYTGASGEGVDGGIIFPNPNAPTGRFLALDDVERIVQANRDHVVIVDEAYIDFGGQSALPLIHTYDHVLIVRTFSKSRSLAGMRIGYAFGSPELIDGLDRIKNSVNSYTLGLAAQQAGMAALSDKDHFEHTRTTIMHTRERVVRELKRLGFEVIPSQANFIFIRHPQHDAATLFQTLKEQGILVRYFSKPRVNQYLRVTIGTEDDMNTFVQHVQAIVQ